ncbi:MAG: hypothetical protein AB1921_15940, partial [Thermodesulfobacteriota bacterium]
MPEGNDFAPERVYELFFSPGEVVEIRALHLAGKKATPDWEGFAAGGTVFGYFDNASAFGRAAAVLSKHPFAGIYFTINPVKPECLARAYNRLVAGEKARPTTSDDDVAAIRWLPVDVDPKRPSGVSSTEEELAAGRDIARSVAEYLEEEMEFAPAVRAMSGNGWHLSFRLPDLPNTEETKGLVKSCLAALHARFTPTVAAKDAPEGAPEPRAEVDLLTFNPARLWKLYGTCARKGDEIPGRPHRRSFLFKNSPAALADIPASGEFHLERLAKTLPAPAKPKPPAPPPARRTPDARPYNENGLGPLKVADYLAHYGVALHEVKQQGGSTWYCLSQCVFDPRHENGEAAIVASPEPPYLTYHCFHRSCQGRTWQDARRAISKDDKLAQFCEGYDPHFRPGRGRKPRPRKALPAPGENGEAPPPEAGSSRAVLAEVTPDLSHWTFSPGVPAPDEVDPIEMFYEIVGKRNRPTFKEVFLARYLCLLLAPLAYASGQFYRYAGGVWRPIEERAIAQVATAALQDEAKAGNVEAAL